MGARFPDYSGFKFNYDYYMGACFSAWTILDSNLIMTIIWVQVFRTILGSNLIMTIIWVQVFRTILDTNYGCSATLQFWIQVRSLPEQIQDYQTSVPVKNS